MTNGFKMFLLAAEELNFSRAADRAFVTQQCLSDHIRRLEEMYHVTLFQRKPKLKLTPEGTTMLRYLSRIQALEDSMLNELSDISEGIRGTINFGVSSTRGFIIIPHLFPHYQELFPNVDIQVHLNDTRALEPLLINGKLDVFLGVDSSQHVLFNRQNVCSDSVYLVISDILLRTHFSDTYHESVTDFLKGADLSLFQEVPFVQGHNFSTTTYAISQFLMKYNIQLKMPISVSDFGILIELCRTGRYATISPRFHIRQLIQMNQSLPDERKMHVFPIKNFDQKLSVDIITHRDAQPLMHMTTFISMLNNFLLEEDKKICDYLFMHSVTV
ncbi:LysR family transcriptional regulator [Clostridium sp. AM58-1XD]|uniref:LysR family transcriptional regulator n=1 Tax=Clostridium sp. AM58-1XD TaxID=2292307 RepID=UPI000E4DE823|nr:LysR family transcriptional regulator [Clostridium sp. AM58-1XD]RGY99604.1 LysR family transcriptional regulator [Clostridium sp. AM58-1XD]